MFNAALTKHLTSLHLSPPPQQDVDPSRSEWLQSLLEAAQLYRLVLDMLQRRINEDMTRTLAVVALNNYAAVLAAMGPSYANKARDMYHSLLPRLSQMDDASSNPLLLNESDMNSIYTSCLSNVFQVSCSIAAPAA
jgi:hypothetical protein